MSDPGPISRRRFIGNLGSAAMLAAVGDAWGSPRTGETVQVVASFGPEFTTDQLPDDLSLPPVIGQWVGSLRTALRGITVPEPLKLAGTSAVAEAMPALKRASVLVGISSGGMAQEIFAALAPAGRPVVLLASPENMQQVAGGVAALHAAGLTARPVFSLEEARTAVAALLQEERKGALASAIPAAPPDSSGRGGHFEPNRLRTVLLVGGTSPSVVDSNRDPEAFSARTGTRVVRIGWPEVLHELDQLPAEAVDQAVAEWRAGATTVEVKDSLMRRSAGLCLVLQGLLERHHAVALAADCVGGIVQGRLTPCLSFSRLEDKGFVVGCEGDLSTLQVRLLLRELTGRPGFTGNLGPVDLAAQTITIWHHTVPLSFVGSPLAHAVRPYGRKDGGYGAFTMVTFPRGLRVTLLRMDAGAARATVATGEIVDGSPPPGRNHSRMVIRIASASRFLDSLLGNHHAVVPGDWADAVAARLKTGGVEVTRI